VVNAAGRLESFNRNFAGMWRLDPAGSGSRHPWDTDATSESRIIATILDQLDEPERFLASVRDIYARSEEEVFDVLHCKDGRVFERYSRPQLLEGRPAGRVWSFRDITKRRRAEAALRESEERFRVLAEVSPVGIFRCDTTGATTFVNRRWCELSGLDAKQALGDGWMTALHPEDRARVAAGWNEAVQHGESSAAEYRFVRADGTVVWLVGQSRAHFDAEGRITGYVGTITDVTTLKRAEEERKKTEAQLRQSQKMESLGTLAGGIAHDFNNILNGTFGFVDLARLELPAGHPVHGWLDRIAASSQRARELVRQILTFSRKQEGERVPLRLHTVVAEALRLLRSTLPPAVQLEPLISPDTPAALADATQIHQVVLNLCTNAWHALPEQGGRIQLTLEPCVITAEQARSVADLRAGRYARLVVTDDGIGMDAATLEHIFEPFFTTKETGKGTGLGLAVVHGIVKSHGGAIIVRSMPGQGTTFELYFPAVAAAPAPATTTPQDIPRGNGERVLVVDDDQVSGFAIEKLVESLGYQAQRCTRPEEALARFAAAPASYDLVISDLAMPGMNGEELIGHMVQIRPDLPVVVASGYVESARQRILEKGVARAVLGKPVARPELARALAGALHNTK
jgi:PAS domain S-box-containing protein